jgi:hypothetical protein
MNANPDSFALIYPQTVTLYQVDDQIYSVEEVATTNIFNTFLDALDGVSLPSFNYPTQLTSSSLTATTLLTARRATTHPLMPSTRALSQAGIKVILASRFIRLQADSRRHQTMWCFQAHQSHQCIVWTS